MQRRLADRAIPADVARELTELRAENARLRRLLKLTRAEASPPGPAQAGFFDAPPGPVHAGSPPEAKVALFGALFAARTDIYAVRWENARTGRAGWLPAVRGGWRKGVPHGEPVGRQGRGAGPWCKSGPARLGQDPGSASVSSRSRTRVSSWIMACSLCLRFRRTNAPMSLAPNSGFLPSSRS